MVLSELTFWWDLLFGVLCYGNAQTLPRKQKSRSQLCWHAHLDILLHCSFPLHKCSLTKAKNNANPRHCHQAPITCFSKTQLVLILSTVTIWTEPCIETVPLPDFSLPPRNPEFSHQPPLPSYNGLLAIFPTYTEQAPPLSFLSCPDRYFLPYPCYKESVSSEVQLHSCLKGVRALNQAFSVHVEPIGTPQ